jgi:hypothetical protein
MRATTQSTEADREDDVDRARLARVRRSRHPPAMLTRDDLASLDGETIRKAEIREGALRLRLASGFIVAVSVADDGTLNVADETSIA